MMVLVHRPNACRQVAGVVEMREIEGAVAEEAEVAEDAVLWTIETVMVEAAVRLAMSTSKVLQVARATCKSSGRLRKLAHASTVCPRLCAFAAGCVPH
eukprot:4206888-Pleurochrysis_carterae.AAC.1